MSKGDSRRPRTISRAEEDLRWDYAVGRITLRTFKRRLRKLRPLQEGDGK
jgi:hypothetical protein